jgi:hypothetical protein
MGDSGFTANEAFQLVSVCIVAAAPEAMSRIVGIKILDCRPAHSAPAAPAKCLLNQLDKLLIIMYSMIPLTNF